MRGTIVIMLSTTVAFVLIAAAPASAFQARVKQLIEKSSEGIDRCVSRHVEEEPEARGLARLTVVYARSGEPRLVRVTTELPGSRRLQECLSFVGRFWRLPPLARDDAELVVTVPVFPGARFSLEPKREEKDASAPEAEKKKPLGAFTFAPGGFWNDGWGGQKTGDRAAEPLPGTAPEDPGTGVPE